jgi:hypothetical protein
MCQTVWFGTVRQSHKLVALLSSTSFLLLFFVLFAKGYVANTGSSLLKKVTAFWTNVEYQGEAPSGELYKQHFSELSSEIEARRKTEHVLRPRPWSAKN